MRLFFLVLIALPIALFAQNDSLACYQAKKAEMLILSKRGEYTFETFEEWDLAGNSQELLGKSFKWVFRDASENDLNDAEILEWVGSDRAAERVRASYSDRQKRGNLRLAIGAPLGVAMMIGGGFWFYENTKAESPSTLDKGGPIVLGGAGLGVSVSAVLSYINSRKVNVHKHDMTERQALELIDRHNRLTAIDCGSD